jgi:hypothetical protein
MNKNGLTKEEQFLLQEYDIRARQMIHEDKLRHQLVSFVIGLSTAVIGGIVFIVAKKIYYLYYYIYELKTLIFISGLILVITIFTSIIILAKIRKSQLLSMNICDNIREYFYKGNYLFHSINIFSKFTFPIESNCFKPSQTLLFVLLLSLFNSFLIFLLLIIITPNIDLLFIIIYFFICLVLFIGQISLFKYFARHVKIEPFSDTNY